MNRLLLASSLLAAPVIALACGPFGQNGLDTPKDGVLPIPLYEAGAPIEFDGSLDGDAAVEDVQQGDVTVPPDGSDDEGGDASDGSTDAESDAASDGGDAGG